MPTEFRNEPITDFTKPANARKQQAALALVQKKLGKKYPLIINGKKVLTPDFIASINPGNVSETIGHFAKADTALAEKALTVALKTFETWKHVPAVKRAAVLFKAAKIMRRRRYEINAWMIKEVGKNYTEADADTAEAIDFLEFYGREMLRLAAPQPLTPIPGEKNELVYLPLGVGLVIPPWNFPFAIMAGMTTASLVTGNTVLLKPSSDAPMMAWLLMEILEEAGLPAGVVNFIPGPGASVGDYLVAHPKIRYIAFTGSMEVGLRINEVAAKKAPGQIWIKRVIAEMGGKDSIVVDEGVDVADAVKGTLASAFGFQGQKCSACSRVIVHQNIYDRFVAKLIEEGKKLQIGEPDKNVYMGPVVNERSMNSILGYIEIAKNEKGVIAVGGQRAEGNGWYVQPTIVTNVKPMDTISQEEIFGPVLAVVKAKDFDDAMKIANNTIYGLTGAVYSKNKKHLEQARRDFFVGNMYLNRKCTGAMVGGHPFGGFNMSGTDSKAGGRDYLQLFTQAKLMSEKID
ncbi:MAG: L-glutamate gamma-semialdehyde dehydrogenase [Ignavibacteriae bacterium]|nr:L-glutamate gamma-semialdehyde dehydrogenase [Ignavibacteriota bacterium]